MNKERIIELAEFFESGQADTRFDLGEWFSVRDGGDEEWENFYSEKEDGTPVEQLLRLHPCNTVACIAGWTVINYEPTLTIDNISYRAGDLLDLEYDEAIRLFVPNDIRYAEVTPAHAAKVLRYLAETGEVDWHGVVPEVSAKVKTTEGTCYL